MSAPSPYPASERTALRGKLLARVRPEFRVEVYLADPDDPVLGRRPCAVPECDRSGAENGLCCGHGQRWRAQSRPTMAVFLANPGPTLNGRRNLTTCSVTGCRYGSSGFGLCTRHRSAWTRDGQPDPGGWAARAGLLGPPDPAECLLPFCTVWTENARQLYCKSHATRWAQLGRPDSAEYAAHCLQRGKARIDFRGLAAPTQARVAICGSMPPRPGHDHHRAGSRGLDNPVDHRRRCDVAARPHLAAVARAGGAERGELPTVLGLRPRRS